MLRPGLACAAALALCACQTPAKAASGEALDSFAVSVDAERWGVIIDKALDGVIEAPYANASLEESDALRADAALKSGAAKLILLRNDVCRRGLLPATECALPSWPTWTSEPPSPNTPLEVLDKRSAWLGATMDRFAAIGCAAGRKASGDELFCSVE